MPKPAASSSSQTPNSRYPGERLGLPEDGAGSMAGLGRRVVALIIDWGLASAVAWFFFNYDPWAIAAVFVVHTALSISLIGGSIGHTLLGMRLNTVAGQAPGFWRPWVRQVLLMLVIPAVIWDQDTRGGHDIASGLVLRRFER